MQDLPESHDTEPTSEQAVTQLSSSAEQLSLLPSQQSEVQRIRDELRDCASYSGVGVISDNYDRWEYLENHLTAVNYKIVTTLPLYDHRIHATHFATIAQSTIFPEPILAVESSDSSPFIIAVFISGWAGDSVSSLDSTHGPLDMVDDIIKPFLPQSAPHLQHIPKLFFINAKGDPNSPPPNFPNNPNDNYCVAYHKYLGHRRMWKKEIADHLFLPGMSVQEVIESSTSQFDEDKECLHYLNCLKNELFLKKPKHIN